MRAGAEHMAGFILDASVALAWVFPEAESEACAPLYARACMEGVAAPVLWPIEVGNVLLIAERRGRLTPEEHKRALHRLAGPQAELDDAMVRESATSARQLAQKHRLTLYDSLYLELALRRRLPLASLDRELRAAAKAEGVPLLP